MVSYCAFSKLNTGNLNNFIKTIISTIKARAVRQLCVPALEVLSGKSENQNMCLDSFDDQGLIALKPAKSAQLGRILTPQVLSLHFSTLLDFIQ